MLKFLAPSKRKVSAYGTSNQNCCFSVALQFSLAGIYQIFRLLSLVPLKIELTTVKEILIQTAL